MKEHNPNGTQIPDHPCRILIIGSSGLGKANALLNLISHQPDIYEIYLYAKYQLFNKHKDLRCRFKVFIEYSSCKDYIYENNDECSPNKKCKMLIVKTPVDGNIKDVEIAIPLKCLK